MNPDVSLLVRDMPATDDSKARVFAMMGQALVGMIDIAIDDGIGYAGNLYCSPAAPLRTAIRIIERAARWLDARGATGVIIKVEGKNVGRVTYARLGFLPVHGCDGLLSAPLSQLLTEAKKRI